MLLYQCSKCGKQFAATSPKVCPYCQNKHLFLLSGHKVHVYSTSDIKSHLEVYSTRFTVQPNKDPGKVITDAICNMLRLPSISIRQISGDPYSSRFKRCQQKTAYETPITVALHVCSPKRLYVLLDSEDDGIFEQLTSLYRQKGWNVLDLRDSKISFISVVRQFLKTYVVPRLQNKVIQKDITVLTATNGDSSDSDSH